MGASNKKPGIWCVKNRAALGSRGSGTSQALDEMEAEAAAGIIGHLETWASHGGVPKTYGKTLMEKTDGENIAGWWFET